MQLNVAIYPENSQDKEASNRIKELMGFEYLSSHATPKGLLTSLKRAIDLYKKESKINYKTLELDETEPQKSSDSFRNHYADDGPF